MSDQCNLSLQKSDRQEVAMMIRETVMMTTDMMVIMIAEEERIAMMTTPEETTITVDPEKEGKAVVQAVEMDQVGEAEGGVDPERDDQSVQE